MNRVLSIAGCIITSALTIQATGVSLAQFDQAQQLDQAQQFDQVHTGSLRPDMMYAWNEAGIETAADAASAPDAEKASTLQDDFIQCGTLTFFSNGQDTAISKNSFLHSATSRHNQFVCHTY